MRKKLISTLALAGLSTSLPAVAVVSLHGAAPHATAMFIGISRTGTVTMLIGAVVVACALLYRYRRATH